MISRSTAAPAGSPAAVRQVPVASSTVVPGAFVVCCFAPVSALNRVDLPTFGPPTSRTRSVAGMVVVAPRPGAGVQSDPWQLMAASSSQMIDRLDLDETRRPCVQGIAGPGHGD